MTTISFDHLHIKSAAPAASAQFYTDAFGARLVSQGEIKGKVRLVLELSGVTIFIEQQAEGASSAQPAPSRGLEHLGLRVSDLDALAARLRAMDIVFAIPPRASRPGIKVAFLYGPDGEYIELIERSAV